MQNSYDLRTEHIIGPLTGPIEWADCDTCQDLRLMGERLPRLYVSYLTSLKLVRLLHLVSFENDRLRRRNTIRSLRVRVGLNIIEDDKHECFLNALAIQPRGMFCCVTLSFKRITDFSVKIILILSCVY